jgi:hypothetical protein
MMLSSRNVYKMCVSNFVEFGSRAIESHRYPTLLATVVTKTNGLPKTCNISGPLLNKTRYLLLFI